MIVFNYSKTTKAPPSGQLGCKVSRQRSATKAGEGKRVRGGEGPYLGCEGEKCYIKGKRDCCLCFERIQMQRTSTLLMIPQQELKETGEGGETGHR